jgi:hypothetical protein
MWYHHHPGIYIRINHRHPYQRPGRVGASVNSAMLAAAPVKEPSPAHLFAARPGPNTNPDVAIQFNRATHAALVGEPNSSGAEENLGLIGPPPPPPPPPIFYPANVENPFGEATISSATQYNIYLGCSAHNGSCWGNPSRFQSNLNNSSFINLLSEYVGTPTPGRYPVSGTWCYNVSSVATYLSYSDIVAWLTSCYNTLGKRGGSKSMYHIFLANGIDSCMADKQTCYSPDGKHGETSWCGYHSYTYIDGSPVYFTVEPYQAVADCYGKGSNITHATANTLSHGFFELISDPGLGAWITRHFLFERLGPLEIGDLCAWELFDVPVNGVYYHIQQEYSNNQAACSTYALPVLATPAFPSG